MAGEGHSCKASRDSETAAGMHGSCDWTVLAAACHASRHGKSKSCVQLCSTWAALRSLLASRLLLCAGAAAAEGEAAAAAPRSGAVRRLERWIRGAQQSCGRGEAGEKAELGFRPQGRCDQHGCGGAAGCHPCTLPFHHRIIRILMIKIKVLHLKNL